MKKSLILLLVLLMASTLLFAQGARESKPASDKAFHIGIITGTVSQSEDDLRGAELMIKEYGSVSSGGIIQHLTYPDNFMDEMETTISVIAGLADDPLMKAIIVNQAIPGTTEAFRHVKREDPTLLQLPVKLTKIRCHSNRSRFGS